MVLSITFLYTQGADAIPPTPFLELSEKANKAWKTIFWA